MSRCALAGIVILSPKPFAKTIKPAHVVINLKIENGIRNIAV